MTCRHITRIDRFHHISVAAILEPIDYSSVGADRTACEDPAFAAAKSRACASELAELTLTAPAAARSSVIALSKTIRSPPPPWTLPNVVMAMPEVDVPPDVVAPARSPVTTTVSDPLPVLLPKLTVLLAPMPVMLLAPSTVEMAPVPQVTAVLSAATVAKVIVSPAPAAWMVCGAVIDVPVERMPKLI